MITNDQGRTEHAARAGHIADELEDQLGRVFRAYAVEVSRPEPWTEGGWRAVQEIRLVRSDGLAMVIGHVNAFAGAATLHTLGHTLARSARRFGRELTIPPSEYLRFLQIAADLLGARDVAVRVVAYTPRSDVRDYASPSTSGTFARVEVAGSEAPRYARRAG